MSKFCKAIFNLGVDRLSALAGINLNTQIFTSKQIHRGQGLRLECLESQPKVLDIIIAAPCKFCPT